MWAVFGRRRAQARLLDQLACGSSIAFVESRLGPPQFIGSEDEREQRTYRLPGAWVLIEIKDNAIFSYSITVTSRRMHYNTKRLSFKHLRVKLGKDKFGEHGINCQGEKLWIGAYRVGYLRAYYFHRSGGSQHYFLSYNMAGCGRLSGPFTAGRLTNGAFYKYEYSLGPRKPEDELVDASGITVNTLSVVSPEVIHDEELGQFMRRNVLGVDEARVRLASTIRPPSEMSMRTRLRNRRFRLQMSAKRALERIRPK